MAAQGQPDNHADAWVLHQRLADRYEIEDVLRRSSTCSLYRVRDVFRGSYHLVIGPGRRAWAQKGGLRWFEEYCSQILSVPPHPNILSAQRMDYHRNAAFLITPDAEGAFWDAAIEEGRLQQLPEMLNVATQVARGVAWLHRQGRIHYNVKPANVIICDSGFVKVWKYGESAARTRAYGSPEQLAGEQMLTAATDVWSWAVSVLHMFVGKVTWPSGHLAPAILDRYLRNGPAVPGLPRMPAVVARLLAKCLRSDPKDRPADIKLVVSALEGISSLNLPPMEEPEPVQAEPEEEALPVEFDDDEMEVGESPSPAELEVPTDLKEALAALDSGAAPILELEPPPEPIRTGEKQESEFRPPERFAQQPEPMPVDDPPPSGAVKEPSSGTIEAPLELLSELDDDATPSVGRPDPFATPLEETVIDRPVRQEGDGQPDAAPEEAAPEEAAPEEAKQPQQSDEGADSSQAGGGRRQFYKKGQDRKSDTRHWRPRRP